MGPDDPTIGEVGRTVLRVERKLDDQTRDHEQRLRRVERWTYALPPTFLLAVASLVAAVLGARGR